MIFRGTCNSNKKDINKKDKHIQTIYKNKKASRFSEQKKGKLLIGKTLIN